MKKYVYLITAVFISLVPISSAQAESAWRYWSYWQFTDGAWEMAMTGPADVKAEDGQVQGWRYITAGMEITDEFAPRTDKTFDSICAGVEPKAGIARVAVVVDYGDSTDYSNQADAQSIQETQTSCVELNEGDPSSLILSSAFETREEGGMVCAVSNLPSSGCGEEVELTQPTEEPVITSTDQNADESENSEGNKYLTFAAALVALGGVLLVIKNKNKSDNQE